MAAAFPYIILALRATNDGLTTGKAQPFLRFRWSVGYRLKSNHHSYEKTKEIH